MAMPELIHKLRTGAKLSQEQFAALFHVSRQSVQKWESGLVTPELSKVIEISKYFGVSLDALILGRDNRTVEEMYRGREVKPEYSKMADWEFYPSNILTEYEQSVDEGLDVEMYQDLFSAVSRLPKDETKKKLGDVLFEIVKNAGTVKNYPYTEPSTLPEIRALRKEFPIPLAVDGDRLEEKVSGAWLGRICGCMLGKTVEGIRTDEFLPFLKETGNYPMHRYIRRTDLSDEICRKYNFPFNSRPFADEIDGMPVDDDTNYTVLAQLIIEKYGRDFTPCDVSEAWVDCQSKNAYCTAERVAFCNFVKGYEPPQSAIYKNPFREWIGAQIRGDYFGYINPGDPEMAAEMAFRDACISHVKNGIYGEMFAAAMIAVAAATEDIEQILEGGLAQIPCTSRLYEDIAAVLEGYRKGVSQKAAFEAIHKKYNEYSPHGWCHTNANARIVAASLLYGNGDLGKSICMAVETGFDTDCNGATVGSVLGMAKGAGAIGEVWTKPLNGMLHTSIFGVGTVKISDCVQTTLKHIRKSY